VYENFSITLSKEEGQQIEEYLKKFQEKLVQRKDI
jgi:hypothetical protein